MKRITAGGSPVRHSFCASDGYAWLLTCHPASGKLVAAGHKP